MRKSKIKSKRKEPEQTLGKVPNSDIRSLYRFITLGIGGFKIDEQ
jgi:hypothetical protein